jgi:hypothetical protein
MITGRGTRVTLDVLSFPDGRIRRWTGARAVSDIGWINDNALLLGSTGPTCSADCLLQLRRLDIRAPGRDLRTAPLVVSLPKQTSFGTTTISNRR